MNFLGYSTLTAAAGAGIYFLGPPIAEAIGNAANAVVDFVVYITPGILCGGLAGGVGWMVLVDKLTRGKRISDEALNRRLLKSVGVAATGGAMIGPFFRTDLDNVLGVGIVLIPALTGVICGIGYLFLTRD